MLKFDILGMENEYDFVKIVQQVGKNCQWNIVWDKVVVITLISAFLSLVITPENFMMMRWRGR